MNRTLCLFANQSVAKPLLHMKSDRCARRARAATLPRKSNPSVVYNRLTGVCVVNLPDLPTESCANGDQDDHNANECLVT